MVWSGVELRKDEQWQPWFQWSRDALENIQHIPEFENSECFTQACVGKGNIPKFENSECLILSCVKKGNIPEFENSECFTQACVEKGNIPQFENSECLI